MSFANLKRSSGANLQKAQEAAKALTDGKSYDDDRFWQLTVDKAKNGMATIRFLPEVEGEDIPFIRVFSHGFKGSGGWYIENCLTTIGKADPVADDNNKLWNTGLESNKKIARDRKRRLQYFSNIYVVDDPSNPDNNGKVFLFKYGKKIFDMLNDKMNPDPAFPDEVPFNPFDLWEGANFKLKARQVDNFRNYDKSEFEAPAALLEDDKALEVVYNQEYPLNEFLSENNFLSYEVLQAKFLKTIGQSPTTSGTAEEVPAAQLTEAVAPATQETATPATQVEEASTHTEPQAEEAVDLPWATTGSGDAEADELSMFQKLAT